MSEREKVTALLTTVPDYKIGYILAYIEGLLADEAAHIPNATTIAAMQEVDEMIRTGSGQHFQGSAEEFFAMLDVEDDEDDSDDES